MASNFCELLDGNQPTQGSSMCRDLVGHDRGSSGVVLSLFYFSLIGIMLIFFHTSSSFNWCYQLEHPNNARCA